MTELRTTVNSMPDAAVTRSATVDLGVRYPSRAIFRNPPAATGTLETLETTDSGYNISIENATATEDSIADFWDGGLREYNSGAIAYRPRYNEYSNAPRTIYEHSVLYNKFEREQQELSSTGQTLVRDDRITIVALNGSLRQDRVDSTSIDFDPISTQTRTVQISNESHNITLSAPTAMNEGEWREVFSDELTDNGGNVRDVSTTELEEFDEFSLLRITLEPGEYSLQMAKVGVGTGATSETESYLTDVGGTEFDIDHDETQDVTVEVRDRFNKPLRGVEINAEAENADDFPESKTTGQDGQATFTYDPETAGQGQTNKLNFTFEDLENFDPDDPESVQMDVTVKKEEEREPGETLYDVLWNQAAIGSQSGVECTDGDCTYEAIEATSNFIQLDMFTDSPAVSGASVDYSLGSGQDGVIDPWEGTTDEEGENSTTLHPNGDGNFDAYVTSGNDADELSIDVSGLPPRADDLLLHLDAYTLSAEGLNDGDAVGDPENSPWLDRTINGFDATQEIGNQQPIFNESVSIGEFEGPTVQFENDNQEFLETSWRPGGDVDTVDEGVTISAVVRVNDDPENVAVFGSSNNEYSFGTPISEPRLYAGVEDTLFTSGVGDDNSVGDNDRGAIDRGSFEVFSIQYTGDTVREFVGQTEMNEYEADFSGETEEFFIGAISGHVGGFTGEDGFFEERLDGDVAEILVYDEDMGGARENVETYLKEKWFTAEEEDPEQDGLELEIDGERDSVTIEEGETVDYQIFETFDDGTEEEVTEEFEGSVTSESPDDVSVDEGENTVTGEQVAEDVTVTAEDEFEATVDVTVSDDEAEQDGLVFEIDGEGDSVTIDDGETVGYTATATFDDGSTEDVTNDVAVTSDDTDVVSVDEDANTVTGESSGEDVTVTADDGEFTDSVDVTVQISDPPEFTSITLDVIENEEAGQNDPDLDRVEFFDYEVQGDHDIDQIELAVENDDTEDEGTASTTNIGEMLVVDDVDAILDPTGGGNQQSISITVVVIDTEGQSETCTIENIEDFGTYNEDDTDSCEQESN